MIFLSVLTIASINVNGLRDYVKRDILFDNFVCNEFGVIFLQETHSGRWKFLIMAVEIPKRLPYFIARDHDSR